MFAVEGRTERSSFVVGVGTASEALIKRSELLGRGMTVAMKKINGETIDLAKLQALADAEARAKKAAKPL